MHFNTLILLFDSRVECDIFCAVNAITHVTRDIRAVSSDDSDTVAAVNVITHVTRDFSGV